ncbi:MAG: hypothetical protein ACKVQA_26555 [Burkholderiales bacterium]
MAFVDQNANLSNIKFNITKDVKYYDKPSIDSISRPYMGVMTYYPYGPYVPSFHYTPKPIPSIHLDEIRRCEDDLSFEKPTAGISKCPLTLDDMTNPIILVNDHDHFQASLQRYLYNYAFYNGMPWQKYVNDPHACLSHVNFALHCSTTACGVSTKLLLSDNAMIRSVYRFHVIYTTRRILKQLRIRLPTDNDFDPYDSVKDDSAYNRLCAEFRVKPETDWKFIVDTTHLFKTKGRVVAHSLSGWILDNSGDVTKGRHDENI